MAKDPTKIKHVVMICHGSDCAKRGAKEIGKAARKCAKKMDVHGETMMVRTKCTGLCKKAPVVTIQPTNEWLTYATPRKVSDALLAAING